MQTCVDAQRMATVQCLLTRIWQVSTSTLEGRGEGMGDARGTLL